MSRSRRKPVVNDAPRNHKKSSMYWRTVRRVTNEKVRYLNEAMEDEPLPDPKEIVDDWNYSDFRFDLRFKDDEFSKKESRK
jgi:hypothetical protein